MSRSMPDRNYFIAISVGLIVLFAIILLAQICRAEEIDVPKLCNAIYKAEGGASATWLYGIRSVKYNDAAEAEQICLNSIRNNIKRWEKAGKPDDFITYMGKRYCPPTAHSKNVHWVKNTTYFYNKEA